MSTSALPDSIDMRDDQGHELAIRVRGLVNRFGSQTVHEDLDLDVRRGEILGVVGGSGTGKSVLMRSILGLRVPDAGQIEVLGRDARADDAEPPAHRAQHRRVVPGRRPVLLADRGRERAGAAEGTPPRAARALALRTGAAESETGRPARRCDQQAALAAVRRHAQARRPGRALALDPPLLFLDEPTAGLDPIGAAAFDRLIKTLQEALGLTVFLITHDLDTLYAICDRVAVIADRKVVANAPLPDIEKLDHPWIQEYFHGPARAARGRSRVPEPWKPKPTTC